MMMMRHASEPQQLPHSKQDSTIRWAICNNYNKFTCRNRAQPKERANVRVIHSHRQPDDSHNDNNANDIDDNSCTQELTMRTAAAALAAMQVKTILQVKQFINKYIKYIYTYI